MASFGEVTLPKASSVAFTDAYPRLFTDAYRVAYRLLGTRAEAEDVAQEACARAFSRWRSVQDYAEPWCVRVAGNLALDLLRARARAARRQPEQESASHPVDATAIDRLDLRAALATLPRRQREVVVLRYLGDQSEEQTASLLGCSVGTVKTHGSRGLARLREVMQR